VVTSIGTTVRCTLVVATVVVMTVVVLLLWRGLFFEAFVLLFDICKEIFAEFLRMLHLARIRPAMCTDVISPRFTHDSTLRYLDSRNVQVHRFITFTPSAVLHEARTTTLDLYTAPSLLLDMLDIRATVPDDLCSKVKARDWFEINWNPLLRPFALNMFVSITTKISEIFQAYTAKLIPLHLVWFSSPKSSLINKIGKLLLHKFLDLLHSFFEAFFCNAGDMKV
jgi:hypothetical protein